MPPHLTHMGCGEVWRVWQIRLFHLPHHHTLLYSVVVWWCGVCEILGVVNIRDEGELYHGN